MNLTERRAEFVYEGARLAAIAAQAPIIPEPWSEREEPFRVQFCEVIERQMGPSRSESPEELHGSWVQAYIDMGWTYGPERDITRKTHPDMVPYAKLGQLEQDKDAVFVALCEIARQWIYDLPEPTEAESYADTVSPSAGSTALDLDDGKTETIPHPDEWISDTEGGSDEEASDMAGEAAGHHAGVDGRGVRPRLEGGTGTPGGRGRGPESAVREVVPGPSDAIKVRERIAPVCHVCEKWADQCECEDGPKATPDVSGEAGEAESGRPSASPSPSFDPMLGGGGRSPFEMTDRDEWAYRLGYEAGVKDTQRSIRPSPDSAGPERDLILRLYNCLYGYAMKPGSSEALNDAEEYLNLRKGAGLRASFAGYDHSAPSNSEEAR